MVFTQTPHAIGLVCIVVSPAGLWRQQDREAHKNLTTRTDKSFAYAVPAAYVKLGDGKERLGAAGGGRGGALPLARCEARKRGLHSHQHHRWHLHGG